MDAGLIDVGRAREGLLVVFEDEDGLPVTPATLRRVEPVQPCAEDDFVVMVQGRPIEVGGADGRIVTQTRGGCVMTKLDSEMMTLSG